MSGKNIAWIIAACGIAAVGAVVALLATGFFEASKPVNSPVTLQEAEGDDLDHTPPDAAPSSPAPRHRGPPPEVALAGRLLDDIPSGANVAFQPLDQRYAGLEPAVGDPLYERLLLALTNAAEDGVTLLARERLRAIYNSLEEFYQGESLLRNAQADIEIICKPTSNATAIILSCSAVRLMNAVTLATAAAHFPTARRAAHFDVANDAIASRLAQGAPPGTVTLVPLLETTLTRCIGERFEDKSATAMAKRLDSRAAEAAANAVLDDGQASDSECGAKSMPGRVRGVSEQGPAGGRAVSRLGVNDGSLIGVRLVAKVVPVGVGSRPAVTAKLQKNGVQGHGAHRHRAAKPGTNRSGYVDRNDGASGGRWHVHCGAGVYKSRPDVFDRAGPSTYLRPPHRAQQPLRTVVSLMKQEELGYVHL